jgi:phytoene synthase
VTQALQAASAEFHLPEEQLQEIIDGMEMDLQQSRYLDFKALSLYCYRVAGVVGLLAAEIFGYQDRKTQKYAHDLGLAFQLTNIIRDVGEDARMGRIYLPIDESAAFRSDRRRHPQRPPFGQLPPLDGLPDRACRELLRAGHRRTAGGDRRAQRPGLVMAAIYRTLLDEIKRDGCQVLTPAHFADADAQAVDRLADLGAWMRAAIIGGGWAGLPPPSNWRKPASG